MFANKLRRILFLAMGLFLMLAGVGRTDFTLTGTDHWPTHWPS